MEKTCPGVMAGTEIFYANKVIRVCLMEKNSLLNVLLRSWKPFLIVRLPHECCSCFKRRLVITNE